MNLAGTLQAMFNSGEISNYIVAEIPRGNLQIGWIEHNLLLKSIDEDLQNKRNQDRMVIPTDRFVRLHRDDLMTDFQTSGVLVFGSEAQKHYRLITVVLPASEREEQPYLAVSLHSEQTDLNKIVPRLAGTSKSFTRHEPQLDYLERMKTDIIEGRLLSLLSLKIPKGNVKPKEWVQDKRSIIVGRGDIQSVQGYAQTLIRWIVGLQLFQETEKPLIAAVLLGKGATLVCLWDGPNGIASFAVARGNNLHEYLSHYVTPLWPHSGEGRNVDPVSPKVVVESPSSRSPKRLSRVDSRTKNREKVETVPPHLDKTVTLLTSRLASIPLDDLEQRLKELESRIGESTRAPARKELATTEVLQRFNETIERLEQVTKRMKKLEERIGRIVKNME